MTGKDGQTVAPGSFRALAAGLLAFCFALDPTVGSLTCLSLQKAIVRKAVDRHIVAGIEDGDLVLLKFSRKETASHLRWEDAREFEYDGRMYDIVETWAVGDTVYYRCWRDHKESELNAKIRVLAARGMGDDAKIGDPGDAQGSSLRSSCFLLAGLWRPGTPGPSDARTPVSADRYLSVLVPPPTPPPRPA